MISTMIFRKPYAILIKNFKLIHILLTIVICYSIYHTYEINNFFVEYMKTTMLPIGNGAADQLFSPQIFIEPILIVIFSIIMLITMLKKDKPKILYVFLIATYGILFFVYNYIDAKVLYLEENILPAKDVRLLSDITLLILIPQIIIVCFTLVRSIGFDIKKFDFKRDLLDMNIQDEDNEEFEVSVSFNGDSIKRKINNIFRNIKYFYLENKILVFIIVLMGISFGCFNIYKNLNLESVILKENGEAFFAGNMTMQIKDSYITKKNYLNKNITSGNFIIIKLIAKSAKAGETLNFAKMQLKTGDNIYYPVEASLKDEFIDLGQMYDNDYLPTKDFKTYLIAYELPFKESTNNITFRYILDNSNENLDVVTIGLKPEKLDEIDKTTTIKLNKESLINEEILGQSKIVFNSFEINEYFLNEYDYCASPGDCFQSREYIRPNLTTNYEKAIMKIKGKLILDKDFQIYGVKNLESFLTEFGTLVYTYNNKIFKSKNNITWVKPKKYKKKNEYYLEINKSVMNANEIFILIQIRGKEYKINIKK